ncbi:Anaphase-promoting complex subunit 1 [Chamberlinius hualienensis]
MISSGSPQVFIPFGREHYARHPGNTQPLDFKCHFPDVSANTDAGEDILDAIRDFSINENLKNDEAKEDWILRAGPTCEEELYFKSSTVIWSKGRWNSSKHVNLSYTVDQPVIQAFWCHFPVKDLHEMRLTGQVAADEKLIGVSVVSASKIYILLSDGQEFIVPLPFQVNGVWTMKYGLLLERKMATGSVTSNKDSLPVVFSLMHPLNEVTPVVQRSIVGKLGFLGDQNQQIVSVFENPSIVITYDAFHKIHTVWKLRLTKPNEEFHHIQNLDSTSNIEVLHTPGSISNASRINSPFQRSCSPLRSTSSRINSPDLRSRSQSPLLNSLTHMANLSRSQSPSALGSNSYFLSRTPPISFARNVSKSATGATKDEDLSELRRPLASEICLESIWVESKSSIAKDNLMSGKASKVFITTDVLNQKYFCFLIPSYSHLRCVKLDDSDDKNAPIFGLVTNIPAKDAADLQKLPHMIILDLSGNVIVYSGVTRICKVHIPFGSHLFMNVFGNRPLAKFSQENFVTSSRPPSALDMPFDEEVQLLSPVPTETSESEMAIPSLPERTTLGIASTTVISLRDVVENRVSMELFGGILYRVTIPTFFDIDTALSSISQLIPKDAIMLLYSKWYMASHAAGSVDTTPVQHWNSFIMVLLRMIGYNAEKLNLCDFDSDSSNLSEFGAKRFKASECGSDEDWDYLVKSSHYQTSFSTVNEKLEDNGSVDDNVVYSDAPFFAHLPAIHFALHLIYEEFKLNRLVYDVLPILAKVLYRFSRDLRYDEFADYYWRDFPDSICYNDCRILVKDADLEKLVFPSCLTFEPPSIFQWIEGTLQNKLQEPFPYIPNVTKRIRTTALLYAVLVQRDFLLEIQWEKYLKPVLAQGIKWITFKNAKIDLNFSSMSLTWYEAVVLSMITLDVTLGDLNVMPSAVVLPLYEAINKCRKNPPADWPAKAYILIGREDLAAQIESPKPGNIASYNSQEKMPLVSENKKPVTPREDDDGMEHMSNDSERLHFSHDIRLNEVQRLLQSSRPVRIAVTQRNEVSDHEYMEEQERHLYSICIRTMGVVVGRGMFTLRTSKPVLTETLPIPPLCLTGRAPPRNTTVDLSHIDVPANMNMWPTFHNGVAAGLRIAHNSSDIDSTWIVYNKPKGNAEIPVEHAGFLMAMGLNGHLKSLDPMNIFGYAVKGNEMTCVGLLLGIAASKIGTMELATTKLLSIHIEALLPPSSTELDIPHIVQVAAVMGIGLVYQGTAHRHMAEVLMSEIGRPPGPEMENSSDCESYSVSAGLALGLIMLGKGTKVAGLSDLCMADHLYYYMVGGPKRPMTGLMKERYKSPSYQIKEGDAINVDVTSPGATLALGFMFFGTNDSTVAQWMTAPDTQHLLDFVRPDFLLLRTLSKGLILWDSIIPSSIWVESHVPRIISSSAVLQGTTDAYVDMETLSQAYCNIVAGACMALGMRFAGSANEEAYKTLLKYARTFIGLSGKAASEQAGRSTIETCINVVILSLATVMAGTGDLEVLRLCRHLHARIGQTHCQFPTHSNDNRYHLQALRHLYVLAVEPRLIIPRDIENGQPCYIHMSVKFKSTKWYDETLMPVKAPKLLPHLELLSEVCVDDSRYWPVSFRSDKNWKVLKSCLENDGTVYVRRRTGCLSYVEDPNGYRSLLAQSLVKGKSGKWVAKPKAIGALTSDATVLNIVDVFLPKLPECTKLEEIDRNVLCHTLYECVTHEKLDVFCQA